MKTINKEQLLIFVSYMEDEISLDLLQEFIKQKARDKKLEVLQLLNLAPLMLE